MTTNRSRLALALALMGLLGLTNGACTAGEGTAGEGDALRTSANPGSESLSPVAEEPAVPPTTAPEPISARPLDDEAVRALAAEVARLRAQLADVTDELDQVRAAPPSADEPVQPTTTTPPLVTPSPS